jgi:hypothetical protein
LSFGALLQSVSCRQPTQLLSLVSHTGAAVVQSLDCRQSTQYMSVVLQIGLAVVQSPFEPQPATHVFVLVLHCWAAMHWLVSVHATHAPSAEQCGVNPLHWLSLRHTTQVSLGLHTRFMPQFASPTHCTQ